MAAHCIQIRGQGNKWSTPDHTVAYSAPPPPPKIWKVCKQGIISLRFWPLIRRCFGPFQACPGPTAPTCADNVGMDDHDLGKVLLSSEGLGSAISRARKAMRLGNQNLCGYTCKQGHRWGTNWHHCVHVIAAEGVSPDRIDATFQNRYSVENEIFWCEDFPVKMVDFNPAAKWNHCTGTYTPGFPGTRCEFSRIVRGLSGSFPFDGNSWLPWGTISPWER